MLRSRVEKVCETTMRGRRGLSSLTTTNALRIKQIAENRSFVCEGYSKTTGIWGTRPLLSQWLRSGHHPNREYTKTPRPGSQLTLFRYTISKHPCVNIAKIMAHLPPKPSDIPSYENTASSRTTPLHHASPPPQRRRLHIATARRRSSRHDNVELHIINTLSHTTRNIQHRHA